MNDQSLTTTENQVQVIQGSDVLRQQESAALDVQVTTAKQYPRAVQEFVSELSAWSTLSSAVAESCLYALPRSGKKLIGPSIRYAELVMASYKNLIVDAKVITEEDGFVILDGICRDLERNVASRAQVRRRITDKNGVRYQESVIESAIMAGLAIARRNAILQVVPQALWGPVWEHVKAVATGQSGDFETTRTKAFETLSEMGASERNVLAYLGREGLKDVVGDDVTALRLACRQVINGESTVAQLFPDPTKPSKTEAKRSAAEVAALIASKSETISRPAMSPDMQAAAERAVAAGAKTRVDSVEIERESRPEMSATMREAMSIIDAAEKNEVEPEPEPGIDYDPETGEAIPDHIK